MGRPHYDLGSPAANVREGQPAVASCELSYTRPDGGVETLYGDVEHVEYAEDGVSATVYGNLSHRPRSPVVATRRRRAVRLTGRLHIAGHQQAAVRYLYAEDDTAGQPLEWRGRGYYFRIGDGVAWHLLGANIGQARRAVVNIEAQQLADRPPMPTAAEVIGWIVRLGSMGIEIAKLAADGSDE